MEELDYKEEIIKMIENIDDEDVVEYFYCLISEMLKAED